MSRSNSPSGVSRTKLWRLLAHQSSSFSKKPLWMLMQAQFHFIVQECVSSFKWNYLWPIANDRTYVMYIFQSCFEPWVHHHTHLVWKIISLPGTFCQPSPCPPSNSSFHKPLSCLMFCLVLFVPKLESSTLVKPLSFSLLRNLPLVEARWQRKEVWPQGQRIQGRVQ